MTARSPAQNAALQAIHEEEAIGKAYDGRLLLRLWTYVAPYRGQVAVTLLLVVPLFVLELAPAWIVKSGLEQVIAPAQGHTPTGGSLVQGILRGPAGVPALLWLAALYLGATVTLAALDFWHTVLMARTGQAAMRDLRGHVFQHIQSLHMGFFDRYPVGRLVTRATSDVENVAEMFSAGIVAFVTDVLKMLGVAVALFLVNAQLALVTFCVVPFLAVAAAVFRLRVRDAFRRVRVWIARMNAFLQETLTGMKVVQLFTREARNLRDFERLNAEHRDAWFLSIRYDAALYSIVELAQSLTVALVVWWATELASIGVIYVFIDWMRRFFQPLRDLSAKYSVMQSSMAGCERIFQLLDTAPAIRDPEPAERGERSPGKAAAGAAAAQRAASERSPRDGPARTGAVQFENVWFSYSGDLAEAVLRDVSFRVEAGERVAFVGATGAGKTTIIKLLTRFYDVTRGRILLDGVDLRDLPQLELHRRLAMVLQDVFLFSGSVAENVALGRADVPEATVRQAARAVQAHRFIERLPDGYQSEVRERGTNFSAGQRQLLSFARALAHGADVLVLDEATSSIDLETEALLQQGIHVLMQGKTCFVIAHRLSTIEDVDRIYVLHHGRIVETGRHAELLASGGLYQRLHGLQLATGRPGEPRRAGAVAGYASLGGGS